MRKRILTVLVISAMLLTAMTACGNSKDTVPDLVGNWKQTNSASKDSYQEATITSTTIEIYWVNDSDESKSLYWSGSFTAPTTTDEPYTWDSSNDHAKTDSSIMASSDDTKTFTYEDNQISYEASAFGTTQTIHLKKKDE